MSRKGDCWDNSVAEFLRHDQRRNDRPRRLRNARGSDRCNRGL